MGPVVIAGLGTAVPPLSVPQELASGKAALFAGAEGEGAVTIARRYFGTAIRKRHFVILGTRADGEMLFDFYENPDGTPKPSPDTALRMELYRRHAPRLALEAARGALADAGMRPEQVTHLFTVSCTGFDAPGVEFSLIRELGLRPDVARMNVGFMGCHGGFNAIRGARDACRADPDAVVLAVSVELCSLHMQHGARPVDTVANALFADGAGAMVLRRATEGEEHPSPAEALSLMLPDSERLMGWHVGNHGFVMDLAREIPDCIRAHVPRLLPRWLQDKAGLPLEQVGGWAIHPGGPRIIEGVVEALGLDPAVAAPSRAVLAERGNLSSATLFFLLEELRLRNTPRPWVALGFGPGLAMEALVVR